MADLQKLVDDLSRLTVLEAADLSKLLEEKWRKAPPTSILSAEQLKLARADLEAWCAPNEFFQKIEVLAKRTTSEQLFNLPQLKFLLDAMTLAEFAKQLVGTQLVRLTGKADNF